MTFELKEAICLRVLLTYCIFSVIVVGALFCFAEPFGKIETGKYEFGENFKHSMNMMNIKRFVPRILSELMFKGGILIKFQKRIKIEWYNIWGKKVPAVSWYFIACSQIYVHGIDRSQTPFISPTLILCVGWKESGVGHWERWRRSRGNEDSEWVSEWQETL